jgi:alpha-ketoglutarate-dependent taurine dioxygenase
MINYHLHENGWTVILDNVDLKTITQEDVNHIARLVASNTCLVVRNQFLSVEEELRVIKMFKDPEVFIEPGDENYPHYWVPGTDGMITRVTGELNEHGVEGIAGYVDEMTWHCNHPYKEDRSPLVWLYGVRGTAGSRTSWNNNIMTYNDLDQSMKDRLSGLKMVTKKGMENAEKLEKGEGGIAVENYTPSVIHTNNAGKTGLFFPFLQISHFVGMTKEESKDLINELADYTVQEKYCYHHDWQDGDLVISEQWLGIHKRWRFEKIATRLLHRAVFDFPEQDYK